MSEIAAPVPGTFYRKPSPEAEPYAEEGDSLAAGDIIGLIEVMKTFVEIRAETPCVLERFLVENANAVEAGQALVSLRTC